MDYSCFVELPSDVEPDVLADLVHASYVASHASPVTLWFRGYSDSAMRAALDEAVRRVGTGQAVEFLLGEDVPSALRRARAASVCVLFDASLRPIADSDDTRVLTAGEALALRDKHGCFCAPCSHRTTQLRTA